MMDETEHPGRSYERNLVPSPGYRWASKWEVKFGNLPDMRKVLTVGPDGETWTDYEVPDPLNEKRSGEDWQMVFDAILALPFADHIEEPDTMSPGGIVRWLGRYSDMHWNSLKGKS